MKIKLHNTKTRVKSDFIPIDPTNVRMYVCGPTVYDRAHLGNGRPVVVFDVLYRLLRHVYGAEQVTYVRNFTDVDDKINAKAAQTGRSIGDICDETIGWFHDDMDALGALRPDHAPRATEYIAQMIAMIEALIAGGHAYAKDGHALFRVRSYAGYGKLSGRSIDDMIAGARVEIAPFKEDPMDFVLWKPSSEQEPGWNSPWGRGRPGWHIECSAMAQELLGDHFDIHGGGLDLQFPHHENEIAQSCCANPHAGFANTWMHNEMLQVEGKKMSKSLGNFFTVRDLLDKGHLGETIRYVFMQTHYTRPMDWTAEKADLAEKKLVGFWTLVNRYAGAKTAAERDVSPEIIDALCNDLNTHAALVVLDTRAKEAIESHDAAQLAADLKFLGLLNAGYSTAPTPVWGGMNMRVAKERLSNLRAEAMHSKDFTALDTYKAALTTAGIEVRMSKASVDLVAGPNFDPAILESLL